MSWAKKPQGGGGKKGRLPLDRFFERTSFDRRTGCLNWIGARNSKGYGVFFFEGKDVLAHRWSAEHFGGHVLPADSHQWTVDHECGNHQCVHWEHLSVVTRSDNSKLRHLRELEERSKAQAFWDLIDSSIIVRNVG